jgi:hypothetical protein
MKTKQKNVILIIMLLIGFLLTSMQASATSPRYMKLQYEPDKLTVTILHFSPITKIHYVYKVDIENNGNLVTSQTYQSQPRFFFYTYTYNITATTGDVITVTAFCSLFGKITRSITI